MAPHMTCLILSLFPRALTCPPDLSHQFFLFILPLFSLSSRLSPGFLLEKKVGVNQPKRLENAKILIANTAMDTDKIKVFGSKVRVDSTAKIAELELAEKVKGL